MFWNNCNGNGINDNGDEVYTSTYTVNEEISVSTYDEKENVSVFT